MDELAELIGIRSTADRPADLRRALDMVLGLVGPGFEVRRFESRGKPSALVSTPGPPRVILNAHLDVVPGAPGQFTARADGHRLYGRGAHDMKAAALVMATVFREVAPTLPYPVALQLVTDEEVGGFDGTGHQVAQGVRAGFVIIGEQSGLRIVTESKGIIRARLTATGRTAHAAYPWLGSNALLTVTAAVRRLLDRHPVPAAEEWTTTVNVARIETSNEAANVVPADASALVDIRFPPSEEDLAGRPADEIAAHLTAVSGAVVTVEALGAPHHADPESAEVRLLRRAAREAGYDGSLLRKHGAADGRFYSAVGVDAVIFGPGGDGQHGPEEFVDLRTLPPYRKALEGFLKGLGG
ncbi:succinyl-diaminopimelate desuccinylase [Actinoplanes campanulatus]|uniref:Succinyl-diaminopimelate desuccinylase n=1 Tax=Actinoplanes campanulatus TaxID=113559 RepID=A0A7W5FEF6_9ACTN|nr:M20/M25/M40 family metallo-hydrolase [Actinoplanes campanulatus]MBB3095277.1 succinyl-diaminopimelate desuccinylase [Actinoplanes campanulatus]GGN41263.1 peptidase M20 [Actinoplanes campanulatus]GID34881.1 peptidase M20 [Actinoplanes campanulatus]